MVAKILDFRLSESINICSQDFLPSQITPRKSKNSIQLKNALSLSIRQLGKLLKMTINPVFDVHQRIRNHDGVLFKKFKVRYCFLVKQ